VKKLEDIAKMFYGIEIARKWVDSLAARTMRRYGADSPFARYMDQATPFLLFVLDIRNLIEHPK